MSEEKTFSSLNPLRYEDFAPSKEEWEAAIGGSEESLPVEAEESIDEILFDKSGDVAKEELKEEPKDELKDDDGAPDDSESQVVGEEVYLDIGEFEGKTYKVRLPNGNVLEIPEGAQVFNKVDGEIKPMSFKEQMSVSSGNAAISKRLSEIEYTRNELKAEKEAVASRNTEIMESLAAFQAAIYKPQEVDPELAIEALSDAFGVEPGTLLDSIIAMGQRVGSTIFQNEIIPKMRAMGIDVEKAMVTTNPAEIAYRDNLIRTLSREAFETRNAKFRGAKAETFKKAEQEKASAVDNVKAYVKAQYDNYGINDDDVKFTMDLIGPDEVRKSKAKGLKTHAEEMIELAVHHKKILNFNAIVEEMKLPLNDDQKIALFGKVSKIYVPGRHDKAALMDIVTGLNSSLPKKKVAVTKKEVASRLRAGHTSTNVNVNGTFTKLEDFKKLIPK